MERTKYFWFGVLTAIVMYMCSGWWIGVNHHAVDWVNFIIIGGLTYWTLIWANKALYEYQYGSDALQMPPAGSSEKAHWFANLDFLRVVFTICVLLSHFVQRLAIWNRGGLSVALFFILSGFLLYYTFSDKITIPGYIKKRLIQFIPLIVLGTLLRILFIHNVNIFDMLAEFFLMTSTGMAKLCKYNSVSWYISVLFWASLFYIYMLKTKKRETVNLTVGILTFLGTVACIKRGLTHNDFLGNEGDIGFIFDMRFVYGLTTIGWGYFLGVIYKLVDKQTVTSNISKWLWTIAEGFILFYSVAFMFVEKLYSGNSAFVFLSFAVLILLFLLNKGYISQWFNKRIWTFLAKYALAIYLVQGITVWEIFPRVQKMYPVFFQNNHAVVIIATVLLCCVFGIWAHHVIEKPCADALKKLTK